MAAPQGGAAASKTTFQRHQPQPQKRHDAPRGLILALAALDFGVMREEHNMLILHASDPDVSLNPQIKIDREAQSLSLRFAVNVAGKHTSDKSTDTTFGLHINFAQIHRIYVVHDSNGDTSLIMSIDAPPQAYQRGQARRNREVLRFVFWDTQHHWFRQTIIGGFRKHRESPISLQQQDCVIDIGRWLTYRLVFTQATAELRAFHETFVAMKNANIPILDDQDITFTNGDPSALWACLPVSGMIAHHEATQPSVLADMQEMADGSIHLPFPVRYQLEVCLSRGVLHESNLTHAFLSQLVEIHSGTAVKILERATDQGKRIWNPADILRFQHHVSRVQKQQPGHCTKIPSAVVTPTTIYYATPVVETSNRVIRRYQQQYEDRFLRVRFSDESYKGKIWPQDDRVMNNVFHRIERALNRGIQIGDRRYEFLAFGSSQFREHGAYFFASTSSVAASDIRQWMGNFQDIKVIAKYVSRLGQCFTTTRAIPVRINIERGADIERNGFCFTDGVGMISPLAAQMVAGHYGHQSAGQQHPSVFQFRLAGCKGVLAVNPMLKGMMIRIRPSQEKFPAEYHGLEICRISQFSAAYLNVQLILVLSALGVPDDVFIAKQRTMLSDLAEAMSNEEKAVQLLHKNIDFNQATLDLAACIDDGFMETEDPFVITCLRLWRSWSLKYLKEKARIFMESGAFVLGCTDETQTLRGHFDNSNDSQGDLPEIFLQISDPGNKDRYRVIEGVCILTRSPALHPGDVRVVQAVNVPALHHLKNCVVLPQTGDRDVANMCSGGDLDGDDFMIIWDQDLVPPDRNHPAMDYTAPPAVTSQTAVTVGDMTRFFVNHIKNDNLSRIAVAHKYWADAEVDGVSDPKCLKLAQLHSQAVDYAKTGVPAPFPSELKVSRWPHWAEPKGKARNCIYHSTKVLGRLYDEVEREAFHVAWDLKFDERILTACDVSESHLQAARELKLGWDEAVRRVMVQHEIKTEFEVFTTFVLEHHSDYNDFRYAEKIGDVSTALKQHHQGLCYLAAGTDTKARDWAKLRPFLAAMYKVTADEAVEALAVENAPRKGEESGQTSSPKTSSRDMPFISFPWIFAKELGRIATGTVRGSSALQIRPALTSTKPRPGLKNDGVLPETFPEIEVDQERVREGDILDLFHDEEITLKYEVLTATKVHKANQENEEVTQPKLAELPHTMKDTAVRETPQKVNPTGRELKQQGVVISQRETHAAAGREEGMVSNGTNGTSTPGGDQGSSIDGDGEAEKVVLEPGSQLSLLDRLHNLFA